MTWKKSTGNGTAAAAARARVRPEKSEPAPPAPNFAHEAAQRRDDVQSLLEDYVRQRDRTPPVSPPPGMPSAATLAAAPIRTTPPLGGSAGTMDRRLTAIEESLARIEARLDEQAGGGAQAVERLVEGLQNLAASLRHPQR
ncbi:MAG: hypothetical protein NTZ56_20575 [Acidobacteria bacterium]|nr:hypothetical protein [Acidobacteriota bacterium]